MCRVAGFANNMAEAGGYSGMLVLCAKGMIKFLIVYEEMVKCL